MTCMQSGHHPKAMRSERNGVAAFQVHAIPFHSFLELLLYNPPSDREVGGGSEEEGQESCGKG
ncbi:unnamed protein product [Musa acuminata subsp. burmannicoides]